MEGWWNRRKAIASRPIPVDPIELANRPEPPIRGDIFPDGLEKMPTRRYIVSEATSRPRRKRRGRPNPMYHKNSGYRRSDLPATFSDSNNSNSPVDEATGAAPVKYRPWGDELLPQTTDPETGRSVPVISYPSVAPPMPPEVKAILYPDGT